MPHERPPLSMRALPPTDPSPRLRSSVSSFRLPLAVVFAGLLAFPLLVVGSAGAVAPAVAHPSVVPTWAHVTTASSPQMFGDLPMAFDPLLKETVLLDSGPNACQSYTWAYHNGVWTNLTARQSSSPLSRE